jgi:hypothetical protein
MSAEARRRKPSSRMLLSTEVVMKPLRVYVLFLAAVLFPAGKLSGSSAQLS